MFAVRGKSVDLECLPANASSFFPIAFSPVHILAKTLHASLSFFSSSPSSSSSLQKTVRDKVSGR